MSQDSPEHELATPSPKGDCRTIAQVELTLESKWTSRSVRGAPHKFALVLAENDTACRLLCSLSVTPHRETEEADERLLVLNILHDEKHQWMVG